MGRTDGGICLFPRRSCFKRSPTAGFLHLALRSTPAAGWGPRPVIFTGADGRSAGVDLSPVALAAAAGRNHGPSYLQADLLRLPLRSSAFDACPVGLLPLPACQTPPGLRSGVAPCAPARRQAPAPRVAAGVRNDIDEDVILATFAQWRVEHMQRTKIPSDTRTLDVLLVRLAA